MSQFLYTTSGGFGFGPGYGTVESDQVPSNARPTPGAANASTGIAIVEQVPRPAGPGAWGDYRIPLAVAEGAQGPVPAQWSPGAGLNYAGLSWGLFATYRRMLTHPTLALAASYVANEILQATIGVEGVGQDTPAEWVDLIRDVFMSQLPLVLPECVRSLWYGFKPLEKVWSQRDGKLWCDLKPHYPDHATVCLDRTTGAYAGMRFAGFGSDVLPPNRSMPIVFGMEAGNLYGSPLLDNAYDAYNDWGRNRLDLFKTNAKLSGILPILKYPPGTTPVKNADGTTTQVDNSVIARNILDSLGLGNGVAIPSAGYPASVVRDAPALAGVSLWSLEFQDNGSLAPALGGMLSVKGSIKVDLLNALGLPERVLMEGEHGTKAEAGVHSENTVPMIETAIRTILDQLNRGIPTMGVTGAVNDVLLYNVGQKAVDQVRLVYAPIDNSKLTLVESITSAWLNCQDTAKAVAVAKGVDLSRAFTDLGFTLRDSSDDVVVEGPGIDVAEYETAATMQTAAPAMAAETSTTGEEPEPADVLDKVKAAGLRQAGRLNGAKR